MTRSMFFTRSFFSALAAAALLSFGGTAYAGIVGSDHDLTSKATGTAEVCIFCHTPHTTAGADAAAPLWNRQDSSLTFTMYDNSISPSIDMTVANQPQGVSMGCLSCHDGATAFNSLIRTGGQSITTSPSTLSGGKAVGTGGDLTNDHPISITYDPALDATFNSLASVQGSATIRLFGTSNNQVECASCHDPHDDTNKPFLRATNTSSQICTTCHNK